MGGDCQLRNMNQTRVENGCDKLQANMECQMQQARLSVSAMLFQFQFPNLDADPATVSRLHAQRKQSAGRSAGQQPLRLSTADKREAISGIDKR